MARKVIVFDASPPYPLNWMEKEIVQLLRKLPSYHKLSILRYIQQWCESEERNHAIDALYESLTKKERAIDWEHSRKVYELLAKQAEQNNQNQEE